MTQQVNSTGDVTSQQTRYLLKDHLGSIQKIVDDAGVIEEEMAFDPWGKRRNLNTWEELTQPDTLATWFIDARPITSRGFTGHKMVDEMDIIHMGGRIYDPTLARFLQADPIVQSPSRTASLNRYSYAWNNPLNAVDPSGFSLSSIWNDVKSYVGIAVAAVMTVFAPAGAGIMYAAFTGAASSAVGAMAMGVTNGKEIMRATLTGGVAAAAFYGVGSAFEGGSGDFFGTTLSGADYTAKALAHGMVGGVMSVLQDGKFGHGFISAGLSQGFSGKINRFRSTSVRVIASATLGGVSSELTGGKFRNGAQTAAFGRLFGETMSSIRSASNNHEDAAVKKIQEYMERSNEENREYGGLVYRDGDGAYNAALADPGPICNKGSCEIDVYSALSTIPEDGVVVASWHTHPIGGDTTFSANDIGDANESALMSSYRGVKFEFQGAYLGSHGGNVHYYESGTLQYSPMNIWRNRDIRSSTRVVGSSY